MAQETKPCPACAEDIAVTAKKCRFCGEWLDKKLEKMSAAPPGAEKFKECPSCGLQHAEAVSYTWWGGFIGPKLLTHVKCKSCGTQYNGKTGQSNSTGIAVYTLVCLGLVGVIIFLKAATSR